MAVGLAQHVDGVAPREVRDATGRNDDDARTARACRFTRTPATVLAVGTPFRETSCRKDVVPLTPVRRRGEQQHRSQRRVADSSRPPRVRCLRPLRPEGPAGTGRGNGSRRRCPARPASAWHTPTRSARRAPGSAGRVQRRPWPSPARRHRVSGDERLDVAEAPQRETLPACDFEIVGVRQPLAVVAQTKANMQGERQHRQRDQPPAPPSAEGE